MVRFQKMIHNVVWFARFTPECLEGRAWLSTKVAQLPRSKGGLAVPDLKLELLALAAAMINKWAIDATQQRQIVGDILADTSGDPTKSLLYVSSIPTPASRRGYMLRESIWITGAHVYNNYGGGATVPHKAAMVVALHGLTSISGR